MDSFAKFFFSGAKCDVPFDKWAMSTQDPATPVMEAMIEFHEFLMFWIIFIGIFVFYILTHILVKYNDEANKEPLLFSHHSWLEIGWTLFPAGILMILAVPSFSLLYSLDEVATPSITVKVIGHQWYWSYQISDFIVWDESIDQDGEAVLTYKPVVINFDSYMLTSDTIDSSFGFEQYSRMTDDYSAPIEVYKNTVYAFIETQMQNTLWVGDSGHAKDTVFVSPMNFSDVHNILNTDNVRNRDQWVKYFHHDIITRNRVPYIYTVLESTATMVADANGFHSHLQVPVDPDNASVFFGPGKFSSISSLVESEEDHDKARSIVSTFVHQTRMQTLPTAFSYWYRLLLDWLWPQEINYYEDRKEEMTKTAAMWKKMLLADALFFTNELHSEPQLSDDRTTYNPRHGFEKIGTLKAFPLFFFETDTYAWFRLLDCDNHLVLPIGNHIRFLITSSDVLHSWAVPSFGIKLDACPGRLSQTSAFIKREGFFFGQCSELCGVNHAFMPIAIVATSYEQYVNWAVALSASATVVLDEKRYF